MDNLLGQILLFPYGYAPLGFLLCDGSPMNIVNNAALYSLVGNSFGGDGRTSFALPDLRNTSPTSNMAYYIATMGIYPTYD